MSLAARLTDMTVCPMVTPPIPHVGGPITPGSPTVLISSLPAAKITDMPVCIGPPDIIIESSTSVLICNIPIARMGDSTAHGGTVVIGSPTVMIG